MGAGGAAWHVYRAPPRYGFGRLADDTTRSVRARAWRGLSLVIGTLVLSLGLAIVDNFSGALGRCPDGVWDKGDDVADCALDFYHDLPKVAFPMAVYALLGAADAIYQSFAYWLMSTAAGGSVRKTVQYSAAYKGVQSLGAGVAWLADLSSNFSYRAQGVVALLLTVSACVPIMPTLASFPDEVGAVLTEPVEGDGDGDGDDDVSRKHALPGGDEHSAGGEAGGGAYLREPLVTARHTEPISRV